MKNLIFILLGLFISQSSFSQSDFSFCYGSISLTIFDGGQAEMVRYNPGGSVASRVTGTFNLYGKGGPTEVLKIQFKGTEYRYELIRDGYGTPSKIFDNQGREYNLCKTTKANSGNNNTHPNNDLGFFTGTFTIPKGNIKVVVSNANGRLSAVVYKSGKLYNFKTSCGQISKFSQQGGILNDRGDVKIYLIPNGCNEPEDPDKGKPNVIILRRCDNSVYFSKEYFPKEQYDYLNLKIKSSDLDYSETVKKVFH